MKIVCVDDEELILNLTVSLCRELDEKPETEGFLNGADAIKYFKGNSADIAILDINLKDMNGLLLASRIKELKPDTAVIFLTGYSEYALDAFKVHASGYLLKPLSRERLADEVKYAMESRPKVKTSAKVEVKTFGEFDIFVDGKPLIFPRKKSKELLAYLIDRNGGSVSRTNAFSALYENMEYDRSRQKQFDVVIRTMRNVLKDYGIEDIFELKSGQMRIIPEKIDCDLFRFYSGDIDAVNSYRGEYMSAYSWASFTEGYIESHEIWERARD